VRVLVALALVAGCERAERAPEPVDEHKLHALQIEVARDRARAKLWARATEQALEQSKQLEAIDADLQLALEERGSALTIAGRRVADAKLEAIRARIEAATKAAASIQTDTRSDEQRLEALPDRCFEEPPGADCKL
jgi:hypothetical protein